MAEVRCSIGIKDSGDVREHIAPEAAEINEALTAALGSGRKTPRARAAYAAIKNGTLAVIEATGAAPTASDRAELIAAAHAALGARGDD
jgi:hypothetical protein